MTSQRAGPKIMKPWGFTAIELMVVVAILAIIAAIAIPSYNNQVQKARRADGQSALMNGAQALERCYTRFNVFNHANCPDVTGASPDGFYNVTAEITATTFTLTATPTGPQAGDTDCPSLRYNHLGRRFVGESAVPPDPNRCWR